MNNESMELEIIINPKTTDDGQAVIQLETAAGAAVKHFKNAHGINVPRSRFLPVKSCSDLLLIKSDIYSLEHGQLVINENRMFESTPVIKLGDHFKKVRDSYTILSPQPGARAHTDYFFRSCSQIQQFQKRFKKIPKIIELDHLTVTGDVYFGRNVTLRGTVISEFGVHFTPVTYSHRHLQSWPTRDSALTFRMGASSRTVSPSIALWNRSALLTTYLYRPSFTRPTFREPDNDREHPKTLPGFHFS